MSLNRLLIAVLAMTVLAVPGKLSAQEQLIGDGNWPQQVYSKPLDIRFERSKRVTSLTLPFFEDFSSGQLDTAKWETLGADSLHLPTISTQRAINPPSKGVATFDGADTRFFKYENILSTGTQDLLLSCPIDLSSFNASDDVYFTFFFEAGGYGDAPENFDSLVLAFDTTGNGDFEVVWRAAGTGSSASEFQIVHFPITQTRYFQPNFRFRFESKGSQNGELDLWHLDYIYLAANRGPEDTNFVDLSPTMVSGSPLGNYTAVPRDHYRDGGYASNFEVRIGKPSGTPISGTFDMAISDPVGGNPATGTTTQTLGTGSVPSYQNVSIPASAFSDQAATWNNYGTQELTIRTNLGGDSRAVNDTLRADFRIDTILAYDDGQPDGAYGLTYARSFCQEYRIPFRDTISAVWIAFPPSMHYNFVTNQSICMDGATFKLTLWDTLAPDSFTTQQGTGMVVDYGATDGYFQRFTFINPQVVDTVFWLGIRQNDNRPLGLGYDRQATAAKFYIENNTAQFTQSTLSGGLMIRPEFANIGGPVGEPEPLAPVQVRAQLFPNPVTEGSFTLALEDVSLKTGNWRIFNMQGQIVDQGDLEAGLQNWKISLLEGLRTGLYVFELQGISVDAKPIAFTRRLVLGKQ